MVMSERIKDLTVSGARRPRSRRRPEEGMLTLRGTGCKVRAGITSIAEVARVSA